jgi:ATP-binding cassette subfamily B (MDR/TAP) protein 1
MVGGSIIACFFCSLMGSMGLGQVIPPLVAFAEMRAAISSLYEIIDRKPSIDGLGNEGLKPSGDVKVTGEILLKNIQFAYPSRPDLLICRDYNLTINAGETVALVGPSGCGKSTIINLLLRFYDPQSGNITLDGYDIKELNIKWLRSQIG